MENNQLISALQTAVSPVILISGVGLLLLTMTNRLGRVIDRARSLSSGEGSSQRPDVRLQLNILIKRAFHLRLAIALAIVSALLAAVLVIILFLAVLKDILLAGIGGALFVLCLSALIASLLLFLKDINLSLEALQAKLKS